VTPTLNGRQIPRLALSKQESAVALGMSDDSFDRYVKPHVPCVRRGRMRIYWVRDLERWLAENSEIAGREMAA
jgi:hypothetical protein